MDHTVGGRFLGIFAQRYVCAKNTLAAKKNKSNKYMSENL